MEEVTKGYEAFIEGKKLKPNSKRLFEKALVKVVKPKSRGAK